MLCKVGTHLALADWQIYNQVYSVRVKTDIVIINVKTHNPSIGWNGFRYIRYNCFGVNDYSILLGSLKFQPSNCRHGGIGKHEGLKIPCI